MACAYMSPIFAYEAICDTETASSPFMAKCVVIRCVTLRANNVW